MTGLESIISQITEEALASAEANALAAQTQAQADLDEAEQMAQAQAANMETKAAAEAAAMIASGAAAAELSAKRAILAARVELIDGVLKAARTKIDALGDADYFALILKMVKKYAPGGKGEIAFCARDLKRIPADFGNQITEALSGKEGAELTICGKAVDIDGGFVLLYGGIEENCSFDALFYANKESLQDSVSKVLFN